MPALAAADRLLHEMNKCRKHERNVWTLGHDEVDKGVPCR